MCTVTFLPKPKGNYILTSNRDEIPKRAALNPQAYKVGDKEIFFPRDPMAGGTWIATDKHRFTLCLLNGGHEKHKHQPPYRRSRGLVLLDFFAFENAHKFGQDYEFKGIEPFTLIIIDSANQTNISELIWTGSALDFQILDSKSAHIWSSSTLYPEAVRKERKSWFLEWVNIHKTFLQKEIIAFHKNGGKGDAWNDFVMDRNGTVKTVSITSIEKSDLGIEMIYEDLPKEKSALSTLS